MGIGTKNRVIKGCGAHHIAVHTRDWEDSLRLYRDVLGMEIIAEFGPPDRKILLLDMGDGSHMEAFPADPRWSQTGGIPRQTTRCTISR